MPTACRSRGSSADERRSATTHPQLRAGRAAPRAQPSGNETVDRGQAVEVGEFGGRLLEPLAGQPLAVALCPGRLSG